MPDIPSDYNAALRLLGWPEEPDCEQCGTQIRTFMVSPANLILRDEAGSADIHRFCRMECLGAWTEERRRRTDT